MSYLADLHKQYVLTPPVGVDLGLPQGMAYASQFPLYEVSTPSYTVPNAYASAQAGLRSNEFCYSLINRRDRAISNSTLKLYDRSDPKIPKVVDDHPIMKFLESINDVLTQPLFWAATEQSRCIGGFSAWEIETNRVGEPIKFWYMLPHFCSFLRGPNKMFRAIRYQPYGMPPMDIPEERIMLFYGPENFDPLYPWLRWLSPSMACFPQLRVDTAMTMFLEDFISHGARVNGLLTVKQTLDDNTANEIRARWMKQHGGTGNWTAPAVLGEGADWKQMQMNFTDMTFPVLDARTETRMCDAFEVPTIVADARAGLDVSSYNNVVESHKNWHYKWVIPTWKMYATQFQKKIFPMFNIDESKYYLEFDRRDVFELKEDVVKTNTMWINAAKNNLIYRDQFLSFIGQDPVDGKPVYIGEIIRENIQAAAPETMGAESTPPEEGTEAGSDVLLTPQVSGDKPTGLPAPGQKLDKPVANNQPTVSTHSHVDEILNGPRKSAEFIEEERLSEKKAFTKFSKARIREGKRAEISCYEFKYHTPEEAALLIAPYEEPTAGEIFDALVKTVSLLEKV
jgi:HK97 family phage portal protein